MAGTYAHIMLVDALCEQSSGAPNLSPAIRQALQNHCCYCKLGAISPDCPSVVGSTGATGYANLMHHLRPADFIRYAIKEVYSMNFGLVITRVSIAWLFGYAAHLVTDMTMHPVTTRKFGGYSTSGRARLQHRLCESHQDVHLFWSVYGKEIVGSDFLKFSGLRQCAMKQSLNRLDPAIEYLWAYCLRQYAQEETKAYVRLPNASLKPGNWYATFVTLFQKVTTRGVPMLQRMGYNYPYFSALNPKYLQDLPTASGHTIRYEELYQAALRNIQTSWSELAAALESNRPELFSLPNADLDTGLANATGQLVFVV